tara:strand:- start:3364 stop:3510 length:147 start_codon:yes stop_codon:yes gene_type:complete
MTLNTKEKSTEEYLKQFNRKLWENLKIVYGWKKFPLVDKNIYFKNNLH